MEPITQSTCLKTQTTRRKSTSRSRTQTSTTQAAQRSFGKRRQSTRRRRQRGSTTSVSGARVNNTAQQLLGKGKAREEWIKRVSKETNTGVLPLVNLYTVDLGDQFSTFWKENQNVLRPQQKALFVESWNFTLLTLNLMYAYSLQVGMYRAFEVNKAMLIENPKQHCLDQATPYISSAVRSLKQLKGQVNGNLKRSLSQLQQGVALLQTELTQHLDDAIAPPGNSLDPRSNLKLCMDLIASSHRNVAHFIPALLSRYKADQTFLEDDQKFIEKQFDAIEAAICRALVDDAISSLNVARVCDAWNEGFGKERDQRQEKSGAKIRRLPPAEEKTSALNFAHQLMYAPSVILGDCLQFLSVASGVGFLEYTPKEVLAQVDSVLDDLRSVEDTFPSIHAPPQKTDEPTFSRLYQAFTKRLHDKANTVRESVQQSKADYEQATTNKLYLLQKLFLDTSSPLKEIDELVTKMVPLIEKQRLAFWEEYDSVEPWVREKCDALDYFCQHALFTLKQCAISHEVKQLIRQSILEERQKHEQAAQRAKVDIDDTGPETAKIQKEEKPSVHQPEPKQVTVGDVASTLYQQEISTQPIGEVDKKLRRQMAQQAADAIRHALLGIKENSQATDSQDKIDMAFNETRRLLEGVLDLVIARYPVEYEGRHLLSAGHLGHDLTYLYEVVVAGRGVIGPAVFHTFRTIETPILNLSCANRLINYGEIGRSNRARQFARFRQQRLAAADLGESYRQIEKDYLQPALSCASRLFVLLKHVQAKTAKIYIPKTTIEWLQAAEKQSKQKNEPQSEAQAAIGKQLQAASLVQCVPRVVRSVEQAVAVIDRCQALICRQRTVPVWNGPKFDKKRFGQRRRDLQQVSHFLQRLRDKLTESKSSALLKRDWGGMRLALRSLRLTIRAALTKRQWFSSGVHILDTPGSLPSLRLRYDDNILYLYDYLNSSLPDNQRQQLPPMRDQEFAWMEHALPCLKHPEIHLGTHQSPFTQHLLSLRKQAGGNLAAKSKEKHGDLGQQTEKYLFPTLTALYQLLSLNIEEHLGS